MKIALVSIYKPAPGSGDGMAEYAYQLCEALKKNHDVTPVYALDRAKRNNAFGLIRSNTLFRMRIRKLAQEDYDIIQITTHELGFAAKILKENRTRAKVVTTVHDLLRFRPGYHGGVSQRLYNGLIQQSTKEAISYSDALTFNSEKTEREVQRLFGQLYRGDKGEVILHGIDERFTRAKAAKKARKGRFCIGYIGSLALHKNAMMILKVAKLLESNANIRFLVYGTGVTRAELLRYKDRHGLDNVLLPGFADEREIVRIYDSFDAFIFPSLYEGFGKGILEAQARGLPVIICKKADIPKETRKYCLEASDDAQMAKIAGRLATDGYSPALRSRATRYAQSFTWKRTAAETAALYGRLLKPR